MNVGTFEGTTSILKSSKKTANNDVLHERAVKLLLEIKSNGRNAKDYNTRRREATAVLRPVLTEIWQKFEAGETVGGFAGKEAWAKGQGITIRWCQLVIGGPQSQKAKSLRLAVGKVVKVGHTEYTLTQEMLDALTNAASIPTANATTKVVHSMASGPTADEERREAEASAQKHAHTKKRPVENVTKTKKVLVARIGGTNEFGVFPDWCDDYTANNALTIGTKQTCEAERDRINAKRAANAESLGVCTTTNTQVPQTAVSVE